MKMYLEFCLKTLTNIEILHQFFLENWGFGWNSYFILGTSTNSGICLWTGASWSSGVRGHTDRCILDAWREASY